MEKTTADGSFELGGITYGIPGVQFHGRATDGRYVPIVIDSRAEPDVVVASLKGCQEEARRLRAAGNLVE